MLKAALVWATLAAGSAQAAADARQECERFGDWDPRVRACTEIARTDDKVTRAWALNNRGIGCLMKGSYDRAIADSTSASTLDPSRLFAIGHNNMGVAYARSVS